MLGFAIERRIPIVAREIELLRVRMVANRPTLGICLGAQLMVTAPCAQVYAGPRKEIAWMTLDLTETGEQSALAALRGVPVLHWHSDTFDLPNDCQLLPTTAVCRQ